MRDEYIFHGEGFLLVYTLKCKESYMEIPTFHRQIMRVKNTETTPCVIVETMVCEWQLVPAHIALSYAHQHFLLLCKYSKNMYT